MGPSGAGKTTVTDLISRFYDVTEGSITLDGEDIRNFNQDELRRLIGIVSQESILFNDTVKNNIALGLPNLTQNEIEMAAKAAYAHDFILEMENGYDTLVGERGGKLSGGQRQRLSIARALLKNPEILILDEATSNLDTESEALIQESLGELMKGRTTFVIAHRLSTIRKADQILVVEDGHIAEQGNHDELIAKEGRYHQLFTYQARI